MGLGSSLFMTYPISSIWRDKDAQSFEKGKK